MENFFLRLMRLLLESRLVAPCGRVYGARSVALAFRASTFLFLLAAPVLAQDAPLTGFIPPDDDTAKAESALAKAGSKAMKAIGKCHSKTIGLLAKGEAFDEGLLNGCIDKARGKFKGSTNGLIGGGDVVLPNALGLVGGDADEAVDEFNTQLMRAMGSLACCGSVPLPDIYTGTIPDAFDDPNCTFKKLDKVGKAIEKYSKSLLKCHEKHAKSVRKAFENGEPRPSTTALEGCERETAASFRGKVSFVRPLPQCVEDSLGLLGAGMQARQNGDEGGTTIGNDVPNAFRKNRNQVQSEGNQPTDLSGCCQSGSSCDAVDDEASCSGGTFVEHGECSSTGVCQAPNCPFGPETEDSPLNCANCPDRFGGTCTPTPRPGTPTRTPTFTPIPTNTPRPCGVVNQVCGGDCPTGLSCIVQNFECGCFVAPTNTPTKPACGTSACNATCPMDSICNCTCPVGEVCFKFSVDSFCEPDD